MTRKRSTPFTCYYCGQPKQAADSSDEHIVPSSIGGTRNATLTDEVCVGCNKYMDEHVDVVFARDWFIESARLLAGIKNKGKDPVLRMGRLNWARAERVSVFVTKRGVTIFLVEDAPDGEKRLLLALDEGDPDLVDHARAVVRARFAGIRVANDASAAGLPYEEEITDAIMALGQPLPIENQISIVAWHRELVKITLGLACKTLGAGFIASQDAALLRSFLFEDDSEKRAGIPLRGVVGIGTPEVAPKITARWHPGGEQHLLALIGLPEELVFVGNLFGKYENTVSVSRSTAFHGELPEGPLRGVAWIVDGGAKTTTGPRPLMDLFKLGD